MALQTFSNGEALSSVRTKINANFTELYGNVSALQPLNSTLTTLSGKTTTGTGDIVLATSPTLVTPVLGVASASSITIGGASGNTLVVDTNTFVVDATNNRTGMLTTAPTHTLTQGSTGTGIALHNVADQTTNFEYGQLYWASNALILRTLPGGSATQRSIGITSSNSTGGSVCTRSISTAALPFFSANITTGRSTTGDRMNLFSTGTSSTASSSLVNFVRIAPTVNQTGTAGYTTLLVNPTEILTGSGAKNLQLWQVGGTTKAGIDNNGGLLNARVISANAATPVNITASDSNKVYTNEGASAKIVYNLPTAVAGYTYTFIVQDTDGIDITAAAGDTIRRNTSVTAAAGTVTSTAIGSTLTLVAINATEWLAVDQIGTWA